MAFARLGKGAGGTGTTSATWNSFDITSSDANTLAVALVNCSVSSNTAGTTCAVTYGGTAMKQLGWTAGGSSTNRAGVGIFYLFNPGTGVKSIVATPTTGTIAQTRGIDVAFSGVSTIGARQNVATMAHTVNSVVGGYALRVLSNGVTAGTLSHTTELAAGASVGGIGDFIAVQSAAGAVTVAFTASGTGTTPLSMGCFVNPVEQINFVQSAVSANVPAASVALPLVGPCFIGDVIVVCWKVNESSGTVTSVVDTVGNTYSLVHPGTFATGAGTVWVYYAPVKTAADAGANTVTVTMSVSMTNMEVQVGEWDGIEMASPLDKRAIATGSATTLDSGSAVTAFPKELIVGYGYSSTTVTAPGASFTARISGASGAMLEDRMVSTAGTYSATATETPTGNWVMMMVTFIGANQRARTLNQQLSVAVSRAAFH